jgi:hypothetical protein
MGKLFCPSPAFLIWSGTHRKMLRVNDIHHGLLALICTNMPHELKSILLDAISLIYPHLLKRVDSKAEGNTDSFYHAIHFDWYNRYTTGVGFILSTLYFY